MTQPVGVNFDQAVRDAVFQILSDPLAFPEVYKAWVTGWVEANPPVLPIGQIAGFTRFTAQGAVVETQESTTSVSYVDLATVGPELTNLPDGHYVVSWGSSCFTSDATKQAIMGISLNGVNQAPFTEAQGGNPFSVARGGLVTMSNNNNNTLKCVYASGANTSTAFFRHRWLLAQRFSGL